MSLLQHGPGNNNGFVLDGTPYGKGYCSDTKRASAPLEQLSGNNSKKRHWKFFSRADPEGRACGVLA